MEIEEREEFDVDMDEVGEGGLDGARGRDEKGMDSIKRR